MYCEQYRIAEGHIWHQQMKCVGTLQNLQLQLGTHRGIPVVETTKEETRRMINVYSSHLLVSECGTLSNARVQIRNQHSFNDAGCFQPIPKNKQSHITFNVVEISMEKMIFSQCDLLWENYIAASYDTVHSTDMLPHKTTKYISRFIPAKFYSFLFTQTSEGTHTLYECNKGTARRCREELTCDSNEETAYKLENPKRCKRKRTVSQLEAGEKRLKKALTMNTCSAFTKPVMELDNRTNLGILKKGFSCFGDPNRKKVPFPQTTTTETVDHCSCVRLCPEIEASTEKNSVIHPLSYFNVHNTRDSCKLRNGGCSMGSAPKDLVLSRFPFGDILDDVRGTYIPQTDSSVDYTVPCGSWQQKGRCEIQVDNDESLYMTNNSDNNINLHVILSLHPFIPTSDVVSSDDNCTEPGEPQRRKCWAAGEKCMTQNPSDISANILTSSPKYNCLQKTSLPVLYIDKENCYFGNNDESFRSSEKTFPALLNYPRKLEKQHFLPNINFSTLAASLLGTPINDFLFFHGSRLQSASKIESAHEMIYKSLMFSFTHEGIKLEQTEVEVSLSTENINKSSGSAHLDYTTAFRNDVFCFPSHFKTTVDTQHSAKDTNWMSSSKQLSFTETFQKICLDLCLVQLDSNDPKETSCSFRHDQGFCESKTTLDNTAAINSQSIVSEHKPSITKHQYANQSCISGTEHKGDKEELDENTQNEMDSDTFLDTKICDTYICENSVQNVIKCSVERNEHMELQLFNETFNLSRISSFKNTICSENNFDPNGECKHIQFKGASPYVTKVHADGSIGEMPVSLENTVCEMKAQFDLVLEELKLFHRIGEENGNSSMETEGNGLEHTCSILEELPDSTPSNFMRVDGDSQDIIKNDKYICDSKVVTQIKEQDVPQQCWSADPGGKESLYSSDKEGDAAKTLWIPAFRSSNNREISITSHTETAVTFSHEIRRVTPLKTRTGPLRIGLSRKAKIKQLHPYLR